MSQKSKGKKGGDDQIGPSYRDSVTRDSYLDSHSFYSDAAEEGSSIFTDVGEDNDHVVDLDDRIAELQFQIAERKRQREEEEEERNKMKKIKELESLLEAENTLNSSPAATSSKKSKEPMIVTVAYKINCISDVGAVMWTFYADMKVFYGWIDKNLVGREKGATINYDEEEGLFEPDIQITNEHDLKEISNITKIVNSKTGEVKRTVQFKGTLFLLSMDLRSFPFDCQNLQVHWFSL